MALAFEDLWPNDPLSPGDLFQLIDRFNPHELTQTLSRISAKLQGDYVKEKSPEELQVLRIFLPPDWYDKCARWLISGKRTKLFHRLLFPTLILQVLARPTPTNSEMLETRGNEHLIGQIVLMFSQLVANRYLPFENSASPKRDELHTLYASMFQQAFYRQGESYPDALGRTWAIIKSGLPEAARRNLNTFDFDGEFKNAFEFTIEDMFTYGFAVFHHYSSDNTELFREPVKFVLNRRALKTIVPPELQGLSERIFDYLALPFTDHVEAARENVAKVGPDGDNTYQLYSIYDHPLVEMPEGAIYALDAQFLRARVTDGAFWALFNALPRERRPQLRDAFGHGFEWYVASLLRESVKADGQTRLWLAWDEQIKTTKQGVRKPDAILREGSTLFFLEVTTSSVGPQVASSGDSILLGDAIKKLWFGEKPGDSAKLRQLAAAITAFQEGRLVIEGVSPKDVEHIRAVLLSLRDFPQWPVLMNWYRDLMGEGGMSDDFIKSVLFFDVGELEELCQRLLVGDTWTSLLAQKALSLNPDLTMHDFLLRMGLLQERHPFVVSLVRKAGAEFESRTTLGDLSTPPP